MIQMRDHETALVDNRRSELLKEHSELEEKLFKRLPLKEKIHSYIFAITLAVGALFAMWLVGYIAYTLISKSLR